MLEKEEPIKKTVRIDVDLNNKLLELETYFSKLSQNQIFIKSIELLYAETFGTNDLVARKLIDNVTAIIDVRLNEITKELKKPINEVAIQTNMQQQLVLSIIDGLTDEDLKNIRLKAIDEVYHTNIYWNKKSYE